MFDFTKRTSLLTLVILASSLSDAVIAAQTCKCMPGNPCYPPPSVWAQFSKSLSKPLIANQRPLADVCYASSPQFSAAACTSAISRENDPIFLSGKSNAAQYTNFEAIINSTSIIDCPYDVVSGGVCNQGRIPPNAVNVTSVADIQKAVKFATDHNLRLVVRNTGYVFISSSPLNAAYFRP